MESIDIIDTVGTDGTNEIGSLDHDHDLPEGADLPDTLFAPPDLSVLLHKRSKESTWRIDRRLRVVMRDSCTAVLVLYNNDSSSGEDIHYILDLRANVHKEKEEVEQDGKSLLAIFYHFERDGDFMQFEVIPTSADGVRDVQAFDFILGQYAFKDDSLTKDGIICEGKDRNPNVVAQSFENTGTAVRIALRSGGRYTGQAIRFLGEQYSSFFSAHAPPPAPEASEKVDDSLIDFSQDSPVRAGRPPSSDHADAGDDTHAHLMPAHALDSEEIERALSRKKWAEGVHSTATSITGVALYPVRWTGRMAAEAGGKGGSDRPNGSEDALTRTFLDTVGGLGNGIMSVCKGVTEAMGEVGSAIGDSAIHHSTRVHGHEYAEHVTQHYVDAASEIGLAGYKLANVAALGWQGVLVNCALEGSTFLISLYEYLMGPVIMQGYMDMMQLPNPKVHRFFVVLRPWSIAFYKNATDITRKPFKIVPTSMLDTLPKLRIRLQGTRAGDSKEKSAGDLAIDGAESDVKTRDFDDVAKTMYKADVSPLPQDDTVDDAYYRRSEYDAFEQHAQKAPADAAHAPSSTLSRTSGNIRAAITQLGGGDTSHIEICTVDCSTYVLYPPEQSIRLWYREIAAAAARVETISKRKSGADEIALYRRLDLYPIKTTIAIKVKRFVRTTPKPSVFDLFIRAMSARNAAAGIDDDETAAETNGPESPMPRPSRAFPELLVESEQYDPNLAADVELVRRETPAAASVVHTPKASDPVPSKVDEEVNAKFSGEEEEPADNAVDTEAPLSPVPLSPSPSNLRRVMISPDATAMSPAPSAYSVSPMRRECQELWETYGDDDDASFHEEGFGSHGYGYVQDADSLGSSDEEEGQYECEEFWETYDQNNDEQLLSGSYFEQKQQAPGDHDKPTVEPVAAAGGSAKSSLGDEEVIAGAGTTQEMAQKLSGSPRKLRTPAKSFTRSPTKASTKTPTRTPTRAKFTPTKAAEMDRTPVHSSALLTTDVTKSVNRAFFSPEVQCSIYPITKSGELCLRRPFVKLLLFIFLVLCFLFCKGTVLLAEKHRIPRAPLLTMQQYLSELQTMIKALSQLIATSLDEEANQQQDGDAAAIEAEAAVRAYRIAQLGLMQQCHSTYALVNPEKVVSDWEVYNQMLDPIEVNLIVLLRLFWFREPCCVPKGVLNTYFRVAFLISTQVGRSCNIICSGDISKLEIKLNRRHAKVSNFSEWGIAELPLQEVPDFSSEPMSGVKSGANSDTSAAAVAATANAAGDAPLQEFWLPVVRRSTGEQIGVLLVEAQRLRV